MFYLPRIHPKPDHYTWGFGHRQRLEVVQPETLTQWSVQACGLSISPATDGCRPAVQRTKSLIVVR